LERENQDEMVAGEHLVKGPKMKQTLKRRCYVLSLCEKGRKREGKKTVKRKRDTIRGEVQEGACPQYLAREGRKN